MRTQQSGKFLVFFQSGTHWNKRLLSDSSSLCLLQLWRATFCPNHVSLEKDQTFRWEPQPESPGEAATSSTAQHDLSREHSHTVPRLLTCELWTNQWTWFQANKFAMIWDRAIETDRGFKTTSSFNKKTTELMLVLMGQKLVSRMTKCLRNAFSLTLRAVLTYPPSPAAQWSSPQPALRLKLLSCSSWRQPHWKDRDLNQKNNRKDKDGQEGRDGAKVRAHDEHQAWEQTGEGSRARKRLWGHLPFVWDNKRERKKRKVLTSSVTLDYEWKPSLGNCTIFIIFIIS